MKNKTLIYSLALILAFTFSALAQTQTDAHVRLLRVPNDGLQPQAVLDQRGVLHLIYFKGEAGGGDVYYVRREAGGATFTAPLRVNSVAGSAVATGTIRGAQLALGKNGRVHVAWNGVNKPDGPETPMWYARMNEARNGFEPQRNVMQFAGGLDGGGSVAADAAGHVYVVWHGRGDQPGEAQRRVWVARSADDGKTFARETAAWNEPTGVCGCCGLRAFVDGRGRLHVLYRAATKTVNRDMYWLVSDNHGQSFTGRLLDKWEINGCPMSSAMLAEGAAGVTAAWETQGQVYFAPQSAKTPIAATSVAGKNRHPALAVNARGETLLVWTEGTGWKRGGALAWQRYNAPGQPLGERGATQGIPVWSFAAAIAEKDGGFTIIY